MVILPGFVAKNMNNGKYTFKDKTGTITVEVDDEDLPPVAFNEKTEVKQADEAEKNLMNREIDVDLVEIGN